LVLSISFATLGTTLLAFALSVVLGHCYLLLWRLNDATLFQDHEEHLLGELSVSIIFEHSASLKNGAQQVFVLPENFGIFFIFVDGTEEVVLKAALLDIKRGIAEDILERLGVLLLILSGLDEGNSQDSFQELRIVEAILEVQRVFDGVADAFNLRNALLQVNHILRRPGEVGDF